MLGEGGGGCGDVTQKKNYANSNISPFQKSSKGNQNPSRYYYNFYYN
jgi:hypothetical protein